MWVPVYVGGIYYYKAPELDKYTGKGIYKYVRKPVYSGGSYTILSLGFTTNEFGLVFAGFIWLIFSFIQCKREEGTFLKRFGKEYEQYREDVPGLVPDFYLVTRNMFLRLLGKKVEIGRVN